jgi:hypothetical protein
MNSLIRRILAVSFIVFFGFASIAAQEPELPPLTVDELLQVVDLNIGLKDIHQAILSGEDVPIDRYYLITGTVTAVTTTDPDPLFFRSEVDLMTAEWVDGEIRSYPAVLIFDDPSFAPRLPVRLPRDPGPEVILPNTLGMALVEYYGYDVLGDGRPLPIFYVWLYKSLE